MKKGFTLIELLAVILILGIIALIAVPQVTNVIENANKGAAETSAEHYIGAVNNKVALNKLDTDSSNDIETAVKDVSELEVDITGETPTSGKVYIEKGTVKQAEIVVNGYEVTCDKKGKCEAFKGTYRYFSGNGEPANINDTQTSRPTDKKVYLKYPIINNELGTPQVCLYDNEEVCFKTGQYEISKEKAKHYNEFDANTWEYHALENGRGSAWNNSSMNNYCSFDTSGGTITDENNGSIINLRNFQCDKIFPNYVLEISSVELPKCIVTKDSSQCNELTDVLFLSDYTQDYSSFYACMLADTGLVICSDDVQTLSTRTIGG